MKPHEETTGNHEESKAKGWIKSEKENIHRDTLEINYHVLVDGNGKRSRVFLSFLGLALGLLLALRKEQETLQREFCFSSETDS